MNEKVHIDKLDGSNYMQWKFKVKLFLIHKGCWDAIEPREGVTSTTENIQKALAIIGLSVKDDQIVHIQDCTTALEAWNNLSTVYQDTGTASKIVLQDQLMSTKMSVGTSVQEHISKLRSYVSQLAAVNVTISDEQYTIILLRSLPSDYDQLVVTLENIDKLSIGDVHARLIREEARKSNDAKGLETTALQARKPEWRNSTRNNNCFYCNKPGHRIKDCRKRKYDYNNNQKKYKNAQKYGNDTKAYAMMAATSTEEVNWIVDSGASHHITSNIQLISKDSLVTTKSVGIYLGNNQKVESTQKGTVNLTLPNGNHIILKDVLYCQDIKSNLLSVVKVQENGFNVLFGNNKCTILSKNINICQIPRVRNNFVLQASVKKEDGASAMLASDEKVTSLWHARLGHINKNDLIEISQKQLLKGVPSSLGKGNKDICTGCIKGKMTRAWHISKGEISTSSILEKVHSDVCGPIKPSSFGNAKYFVTFIDDYSRMVFTYTMQKKSQVPEIFKTFKTFVEKQTGKHIMSIKSDNGGEYINTNLASQTEQSGINHYLSPPYTPELNGVAERCNRTLLEMVRSMLYYNNCPLPLWGETLRTSQYLLNLRPRKYLGSKSPLNIWNGRYLYATHLKVFGCTTYTHVPKELRSKLQSKAREAVFVGYTASPKVYRLMDPKTNRIFTSDRVVFNEDHSIYLSMKDQKQRETQKEISVNLQMNENSITSQTEDESVPVTPDVHASENDVQSAQNTSNNVSDTENEEWTTPRRSTRVRSAPLRLTYEHTITDDEDEDVAVMYAGDSITFTDALTDKYWKNAMDLEYKSLLDNNTWDLAPLPPGRVPVTCKWVFKIKNNENGNKIHKARLVARGFSQKAGIDYQETYAPTVRLSSIRVFLSVSVQEQYHIHQMDAKAAFLQGDLDEDIYMTQPPGYAKGSNTFCHLKKALYGLKQAPRQWFKRIKSVLETTNFKMSCADNGVYVGYYKTTQVLICIYVDDLLISSSDMDSITFVKQLLTAKLNMKDLGILKSFLNISMAYNKDEGSLFMNQSEHITSILQRFGMKYCNPVSTPLLSINFIREADINEHHGDHSFPYRQAVGSLMFIMLSTRPDIAFSVSVLSRFLTDPKPVHWQAVKRVFRYLKGTINYKLKFQTGNNEDLTMFGDADWANDIDRKSVSGLCVFHGKNITSWGTKKQSNIALSTTEAELIASSEVLREGLWTKKLLQELSPTNHFNCTLYSDNQPCIRILKSNESHNRTKHIDVKYLHIQESAERHNIAIIHCPSEHMIADVFTKALATNRLFSLCQMLHLNDEPPQNKRRC